MIEMNDRILIVDTETTNSLDDPMCYDVGFRVFDMSGKVYEEASLVNRDVFCDSKFMASAFYADKIPQYWRDIWDKKRELLTWQEIKWRVWDACLRNEVKYVVAHNAIFDYRSLHWTQRYITTSKYRWFMPWGVTWLDTLKMCREVFKADENYRPWCEAHGYMTANNQPRLTAEIVYRYITGREDFEESHTGLEDVKIEMDIFMYCLLQNPELDARLWPERSAA